MTRLIHLAPANLAQRIVRNGIKAAGSGWAGADGVFCMPVLPNFQVTFQWARELKRSQGGRHRTIIGIVMELREGEPVFVGHYGREPMAMTLGEAVAAILGDADGLGWQIFVPRSIHANEIRGLRHVPPNVGWRYSPNAHGRAPCPCPLCTSRGDYGVQKIMSRDREIWPDKPTPQVLLERLGAAGSNLERADLITTLCARMRRGPETLARLMNDQSPEVRTAVATALGYYSGRKARLLLQQMATDPDHGVRRAVEEQLGD